MGLLGLAAVLFGGGCVVHGPYPAGVSVGVYGEYPHTYYGGGYYYHHPYYGNYYHTGRWYQTLIR
jgi:hypothetical protein